LLGLQFPQTPSDGIAIQARDPGHQRNATAAVLLGQEANQKATQTLIGQSDQAVDAAVLRCDRAIGVLLAMRALALGQFSPGILLVHKRFPLGSSKKRTNAFYHNRLKLFLHNALIGG
jgi:hypothetical protein